MKTTLQDGKSLSQLASIATLVFDFPLSSSTWVVPHNLGRYPVAVCVESTNTIIEGRVQYNGLNQLTVEFNSAVSGKVYIN